ncbi:MAG TPA: hypothetical protein PLR90_04440 [Methylophilus sp.]|nr:hypothetical protein [Methylophilus sp.]
MGKQLYSDITIDDLKLLIWCVDYFEAGTKSNLEWMAQNQRKFTPDKLGDLLWAPFYELPFYQVTLGYFNSLGIQPWIDEANKASDKATVFHSMINELDGVLDADVGGLEADERKQRIAQHLSLSKFMEYSIKCVLIYGVYLSELIRIARENPNIEQADKALLKAVRIDPSVASCPTAAARISKAVLFSDTKFLKLCRNALSGKLRKRESANYKKMRHVLRTLHDSGIEHLSDAELKKLFVDLLDLYKDPQFTAEKNLGEFARNFDK